MVAVMQVEDPLSDPLGSRDALLEYSVTDSSSDEREAHRPSFQVSGNGQGESVRRLPAYVEILTDDSIPAHDFSTPKKRGRKKGSKNKFKRGIPIELWNQFANSGILISKDTSPEAVAAILQRVQPSSNEPRTVFPSAPVPAPAPVSVSISLSSQPQYSNAGPNANGEFRQKRKYTKRPKIDLQKFKEREKEQIELSDSEDNIVLELDPACFYPDEPERGWKQYRRRRLEKWKNMPMHCEICHKGFKHAKGVQIHKASKHGIEDLSGAYPCECCEQVFWMKRELREHLMVHRDASGRLPCPENCGATESEPAGLVRHKQKYHPYLGTLGRNWFHTWGDR